MSQQNDSKKGSSGSRGGFRSGGNRSGGFRSGGDNGGFRRNNFSMGPREMHKAICSDCKKDCEVPFKPIDGKPVYCKECYPKHKSF